MKLIFVGHEGDETEALECIVDGISFPRGEEVAVSGDVFERLSPNPAFKAVPGAKPGRPRKAEVEGTE